MLLPKPEDAIHKAWLYRLLTALADDLVLMQVLRFKGGTCAAMTGYLNRFSVDLDFDYIGDQKTVSPVRQQIAQLARHHGLIIKDQSKAGLQFFFKYSAPSHKRNTIKLEAQFPPPQSNQYAPVHLSEIDRTVPCQTIETMFANKLVAMMDRYEADGSIAGRDLYDIYQFFSQGLSYLPEIIVERRGTTVTAYLQDLIKFIQQHITTTIINQDLNPLLPTAEFHAIRSTLKAQVLVFLKDELARHQAPTDRQRIKP